MQKPQPITIAIEPEVIQKIHQAYRYTLCSDWGEVNLIDQDQHNSRLAQMLSRLLLQKYLIKEKIPFTVRQNNNPSLSFQNKLLIGGRPVNFFLNVERGEPEAVQSPRLFLTKNQVESLKEQDDLNIFGTFLRKYMGAPVEVPGFYYFFPAILAHKAESNSPGCLISSSQKHSVWAFTSDREGLASSNEISLTPGKTTQVSLNAGFIRFLYLQEKPAVEISVSYPGQTYFNIQPADWTAILFDPSYLILTGYRSSLDLKISAQQKLSIDTQSRIRYFKTQKLEINPSSLRSLTGLFDYAKLLDKGE